MHVIDLQRMVINIFNTRATKKTTKKTKKKQNKTTKLFHRNEGEINEWKERGRGVEIID